MIIDITIISNVVGEVPIRVGSPEGGSHEGGSQKVFPTDGWRTHKYGNLHVCKNLFFFFPTFFPSCFSELS